MATARSGQLDRQIIDIRNKGLALTDQLRAEKRGATEQERATINALVAQGNALAQQRDDLDAFAGLSARFGGGHPDRPNRSLGAQFVNSDLYAELLRSRTQRSGPWSSASAVELFAATLTEDPASGGALVVPQYRPGIVPLPLGVPRVADLFAPGTATSNTIIVTKEKTATNAATATGEGQLKPESTLVFESGSQPVIKVPTWIPVSEELLEDSAQAESYINARLSLFVALATDDELLNGSGLAPHMTGLMNRTDLAAAVPATAGEELDAIATQIGLIEATTQLEVSAVVLNPTTWTRLALVKTTTGEYLSGSPFATASPATIWRKPVVLTSTIDPDVALIGAFSTGAQLFRRGGIQLAATNSHQDYFVRNLVALRAESRFALAVYRSTAFGKVTGLETPVP